MPRIRAKLDPLLLSSSGRRVEDITLKMNLQLQDLDDVALDGAIPGDALIYSPENGGWVPNSTTIAQEFSSGESTGVALSQDILVLDSNINPKGIIIDNEGLVIQEYLIEDGGYPYSDASWNSIKTFNFSDNLQVKSVQLNSDTGLVTANIVGTDPVFAVYKNSGSQTVLADGSLSIPGPLSTNVRELNFVGTIFDMVSYPSQHFSGAEQVKIEVSGYDILTNSIDSTGLQSAFNPLSITNGSGASLNTSGTIIQVNTDLSLYDNVTSDFGPKVFIKDTGAGSAYWPDPAGYDDLNNLTLGMGTDNPTARVEIARGYYTGDVFDITNHDKTHLKISNNDYGVEASNFLTVKVGQQGWTYIRNKSDDFRMDYSDLSDAEKPATGTAPSQAHISIHAQAQLRLHSDLGIFKFIAGEHKQQDSNNIDAFNHPRFQINTVPRTGATTLQTINPDTFIDTSGDMLQNAHMTLRADGDLRLHSHTGDFVVTTLFEGHPRMSLFMDNYKQDHGETHFGVFYKKEAPDAGEQFNNPNTLGYAAAESILDRGMKIHVQEYGETTIKTTYIYGEQVYSANRGTTDDGETIVANKGTALNFYTTGNYYFDSGSSYSVNFQQDDRRHVYLAINADSNSGLFFPNREGYTATGGLYQGAADGGITLASTVGNLAISAESTMLITSSGDMLILTQGTGNLTINSATSFINIGANKIGTSTSQYLRFQSNNATITAADSIYLTAANDVVIPVNVGLILDGSGAEKIESNGTDINISVGSGGDINIPQDIGIVFGDDGEKIEGDGTDLTISSSNDLHLTATTDINIPADVGLTFGNDGEKIEGDGTDLTISSSGELTLDVEGDLTIDVNGADILLKDDGTAFGRFKRDTSDFVIKAEDADNDILLKGIDGSTTITALKQVLHTLIMI